MVVGCKKKAAKMMMLAGVGVVVAWDWGGLCVGKQSEKNVAHLDAVQTIQKSGSAVEQWIHNPF